MCRTGYVFCVVLALLVGDVLAGLYGAMSWWIAGPLGYCLFITIFIMLHSGAMKNQPHLEDEIAPQQQDSDASLILN